MKSKVFIVLMLMCIATQAQNRFRTDFISEIEVVNVTSANKEVTMEPRAIMADVGGIVKVLLKKDNGKKIDTVCMVLPDYTWVPVGNVIKVFRYYTGTTATTAQVYDSTGTVVTGVKVGR